MDYQKLAAAIVKNVGGEENIQMVNHCMTRLRFNLKDVSKADKAALEDLNGVLGVVYAGEQYMVILGQHLIPTYEAIVKNYSVTAGAAVDENLDDLSQKKEPLTWKNWGSKFIGFISASVTPLIPGLIAGGMLKVVLKDAVVYVAVCDCRRAILLHANHCGIWCGKQIGWHTSVCHGCNCCTIARQLHQFGH